MHAFQTRARSDRKPPQRNFADNNGTGATLIVTGESTVQFPLVGGNIEDLIDQETCK
ncbi:hypothetical protein [Rhodococcus sp. IEGM 1330]|uniref:hypothetical protein n=1 Tax=Rhodococcus sp. IEGM 1330 TaxID=3082225 RepID=UPI002955BAE1|nr:hypothetical protein [Rhodococcus sp. IEGM 1330]MDV8021838.1 hypothetical protein [Rhodococcus sp. IEGM 1330]